MSSYPAPGGVAVAKELDRLDVHCRSFIEIASFVVLPTATAGGVPDVSPRRGPPGFVRIVDDRTLALPDRLGNNRLDSLRKIVDNPRVALHFIVPGINDTLRVYGTGHLTTAYRVGLNLTERGRGPQSVLLISVDSAFVHCAKALMRGRLWDVERHVPVRPGPQPARSIEPTRTLRAQPKTTKPC